MLLRVWFLEPESLNRGYLDSLGYDMAISSNRTLSKGTAERHVCVFGPAAQANIAILRIFGTSLPVPSAILARGSKYPISKDSGPRNNYRYGVLDQRA